VFIGLTVPTVVNGYYVAESVLGIGLERFEQIL
jgi:hypothetical protein